MTPLFILLLGIVFLLAHFHHHFHHVNLLLGLAILGIVYGAVVIIVTRSAFP